MNNKKYAILSDIHGNRKALEAVLFDIKQRNIDQVLNLGDCLYGPLDPVGTAEILIRENFPTVWGNQDRIIFESLQGNEDSPSLNTVKDQLRDSHLDWLLSLQKNTFSFDYFLLCHGSPEKDDEYLLYKVGKSVVENRKPEEIMDKLANFSQQVILCGHDHVPRTVLLPNGTLVVNPGSVGLPAYFDDLPFPHIMESLTPHAKYCIIFQRSGDWQVEHIAVPYDYQWAVDLAEQNGRPDWSQWLKTGSAHL